MEARVNERIRESRRVSWLAKGILVAVPLALVVATLVFAGGNPALVEDVTRGERRYVLSLYTRDLCLLEVRAPAELSTFRHGLRAMTLGRCLAFGAALSEDAPASCLEPLIALHECEIEAEYHGTPNKNACRAPLSRCEAMGCL